MADSAQGCLLFAIPARLLGRGRTALPGPVLPTLPTSRVHRDDLPALVAARKAAEGCVASVGARRGDVADGVVADVAGKVAALLGHVYAMGERAAEARAYLDAHAPERLARERTDLEMELVGASADQIVQLKRTLASLERRAASVGKVDGELARLKGRMGAAVAELKELEARVGAELGADDLMHELAAHQQAAELALQAFGETWKELEDA